MMDRPTCRTCPFWDCDQRGEPTDETDARQCRRLPPQINQEWADTHGGNVAWPTTFTYDWCGEHPDFPAYLASLRVDGAASQV